MTPLLLIAVLSAHASPADDCRDLAAWQVPHAFCLAERGSYQRCDRLTDPVQEASCKALARGTTSACSTLVDADRKICEAFGRQRVSDCMSARADAESTAWCRAVLDADDGWCSRTGDLRQSCQRLTPVVARLRATDLLAPSDPPDLEMMGFDPRGPGNKPPPLNSDMDFSDSGATCTTTRGVVLKNVRSETPLDPGTVCKVVGRSGDWVQVTAHTSSRKRGWIEMNEGDELANQPELPRGEITKVHYEEINAPLFNGTPGPGDVAQGHLNDCFLVAGMAAVAHATPEMIQECLKLQKNGKIEFSRHYTEGPPAKRRRVQTTEIDAWLPAKDGFLRYGLGDKDRPELSIDELNDGKRPMWPAMLEKGWAQLGGGYKELEGGGYDDKVIAALTGQPVDSTTIQDLQPKQLIDIIQQGAKYRQPMTAGSKTKGRDGVVGNHVYVVTGATTASVMLINPWEGHRKVQVPVSTFMKQFESISVGRARGL